MKFYAVHNNLASVTAAEINNIINSDDVRYRQVFPTRPEAEEYAKKIKSALQQVITQKIEKYENEVDWLKGMTAYKLTRATGVSISVSSFKLEGKKEIAQALSTARSQEFNNFDEECGQYDHYGCAVFFWDELEGDTRHNAILREPSYDGEDY